MPPHSMCFPCLLFLVSKSIKRYVRSLSIDLRVYSKLNVLPTASMSASSLHACSDIKAPCGDLMSALSCLDYFGGP
jgi:hypothetical protein